MDLPNQKFCSKDILSIMIMKYGNRLCVKFALNYLHLCSQIFLSSFWRPHCTRKMMSRSMLQHIVPFVNARIQWSHRLLSMSAVGSSSSSPDGEEAVRMTDNCIRVFLLSVFPSFSCWHNFLSHLIYSESCIASIFYVFVAIFERFGFILQELC